MKFLKHENFFLLGRKNCYIRAALDAALSGTVDELKALFESMPDLYNMTVFPASDDGVWKDHTLKDFYLNACMSGDIGKIDFVTSTIAKNASLMHFQNLFNSETLRPYNQALGYIGEAGNDATCLEILGRFDDVSGQVDALCDMYKGALLKEKASTIKVLERFFEEKCRPKYVLMIAAKSGVEDPSELEAVKKMESANLSDFVSSNDHPTP